MRIVLDMVRVATMSVAENWIGDRVSIDLAVKSVDTDDQAAAKAAIHHADDHTPGIDDETNKKNNKKIEQPKFN